METTFKQYVLDWWELFLENNEENQKSLMKTFIGKEETVEDYLEPGETPIEWLSAKDDADEIYKHFFGYEGGDFKFNELPDTQEFLKDMFNKALDCDYDFVEELVENMAYLAEGYSSPIGFFNDLSYGGCSSGIVGMFIYNSDCKRFYIDHIDSMESFVEDLSEELGEDCVKALSPRYTHVCWLCYEEIAHKIAIELYPNKF